MPKKKDALLIALVLLVAGVLLAVSHLTPKTDLSQKTADVTLAPDAIEYLDTTPEMILNATGSPEPESTPTVEPDIPQELVIGEVYHYGRITENEVRFRKTVNGESAGYLNKDTILWVIDNTDEWARVRVEYEDGETRDGYVLNKFIKLMDQREEEEYRASLTDPENVPSPTPTKVPTPEPTATPVIYEESKQAVMMGPMPAPQTAEVRGHVVLTVGTRQYGDPIPMDRDKVITIKQTDGKVNKVHITPEKVYMESSSCDNQDCVGQGEISLANYKTRILSTFVICLPNEVTIEMVPVE